VHRRVRRDRRVQIFAHGCAQRRFEPGRDLQLFHHRRPVIAEGDVDDLFQGPRLGLIPGECLLRLCERPLRLLFGLARRRRPGFGFLDRGFRLQERFLGKFDRFPAFGNTVDIGHFRIDRRKGLLRFGGLHGKPVGALARFRHAAFHLLAFG
jgi:hypothetical protein